MIMEAGNPNVQLGWQTGVGDPGRADVSVQGLSGRKRDVGDEAQR